MHPSVSGYSSWKDSWRERHTHHARRGKGIASDAACAGRSNVAASASGRLSAYDEQACRENVQPLGQFQTDVHADAQNVACTKGGRCSEVFAHLFLAGTGQQDNTRPPLNVFVAEGEDSRPSNLRRGSMNH